MRLIFTKKICAIFCHPIDDRKEKIMNDSNTKQQIITLNDIKEGSTCSILKIQADDINMENFLFSLGCFEGEEISVISRLEQNIIITIKEARYSIDTDLAAAIHIK